MKMKLMVKILKINLVNMYHIIITILGRGVRSVSTM